MVRPNLIRIGKLCLAGYPLFFGLLDTMGGGGAIVALASFGSQAKLRSLGHSWAFFSQNCNR